MSFTAAAETYEERGDTEGAELHRRNAARALAMMRSELEALVRERAPHQRRERVPRAPTVANRARQRARPVVSRSTIRDRARVRTAYSTARGDDRDERDERDARARARASSRHRATRCATTRAGGFDARLVIRVLHVPVVRLYPLGAPTRARHTTTTRDDDARCRRR